MSFKMSSDRVFCPRSMITCHARRRLTLYVFQGWWLHVFPDGIRPFLMPKRHAGMPCLTSSDRVWSLKMLIAWHAQRLLPLCAVQGIWLHATPDVVSPCVLSKGNDNMPQATSSDLVYCLRAMMACNARHRPFVFPAQGTCGHSISDVVWPCVKSKDDDSMTRSTTFDSMCCPR